MSGYDALDELYERLREAEDAQDARRAGGITAETIRAARGGAVDVEGREYRETGENAADGDSEPLAGIPSDSRERIEADAWEAARLDMSLTWEERRDAIVALLDRQAALTERETKLRELYKFEENHREHVRSIEEVNQQLNERIAELQAELDEYGETHMERSVEMDKTAAQEYNLDVQVVAESKIEYTVELRRRRGATTSMSAVFHLE